MFASLKKENMKKKIQNLANLMKMKSHIINFNNNVTR